MTVGVVLKKPKRKRGFNKEQLEKLTTFSQELTALGGVLLDAQRQVAPSVSLVVRLAISPKSNPEGAAWSPCATLFRRA